MTLVLTLCAGILSANPGCVVDRIKLLPEVTPQACINKAQEKIAMDMPKYPGMKVVKWGCERKHG